MVVWLMSKSWSVVGQEGSSQAVKIEIRILEYFKGYIITNSRHPVSIIDLVERKYGR